MTCIFNKLYSNSTRSAFVCDSLTIFISIFQIIYNNLWFQICIIILSFFHVLLIWFQDKHLQITLSQLEMQNNLANTNIEKHNIQLSELKMLNNIANIQFSKLEMQTNIANSTLKTLHKHNKIIYKNLAKELYTQFENSAHYNSLNIKFFDKLKKIKEPNTKITDTFNKYEFNNIPAIDIVNELLYNLGPNSST